MKLRTTARSIRLRLSQTDVRQFAEIGTVEETIAVNPETEEQFAFRLVRWEGQVPSVGFEKGVLTVSIPAKLADDWTSTDRVGIEGTHPNGTPDGLNVLIEKDFTCLQPREGDDDKDTFPNPIIAHNC
jgi:hypothetical protein